MKDLDLGELVEIAGDYTFSRGRQAMQTLLEDAEHRPDAIFAGNDLTALGALSILHEQGIIVPDEIAIVGFDNIEEATWSIPPLMTVNQPATEIGEAAARLLIGALKGTLATNTIDVTCTLIPRASA